MTIMRFVVLALVAATAANAQCAVSDQCKIAGGQCFSKERCDREKGTNLNGLGCSATSGDCICCKPATQPDCTQADDCVKAGGSCRKECPTGFSSRAELCFFQNEGCTCCVPPTCPLTEKCKILEGECVSKEACEKQFAGALFDWDAPTCNSESPDCGCCRGRSPATESPVSSGCKQTDACSDRDGQCRREEDCNANTHDWVQRLCVSTRSATCGCCIKKPEATKEPTTKPIEEDKPCEQYEECGKVQGKCIAKSVCETKFPTYEWVATLCKSNSPDCGCCKPKATSNTCKQTDACEKVKGECKTQQACSQITGMQWVQSLCANPTGSNVKCGCCKPMPKTESPTKDEDQCQNLTPCVAQKGQCKTKEECLSGTASNMEWLPKFCENSDNARDPKCGCCKEKPKTEKPSSPNGQECKQEKKCIAVKGKCMTRAACSQFRNMIWDDKLCGLMEDDCGCCRPTNKPTTQMPTTEKPVTQKPSSKQIPCKPSKACSKRGGKCKTKEACTTEFPDFVWRPEFCDNTAANPDACGCCSPASTGGR